MLKLRIYFFFYLVDEVCLWFLFCHVFLTDKIRGCEKQVVCTDSISSSVLLFFSYERKPGSELL